MIEYLMINTEKLSPSALHQINFVFILFFTHYWTFSSLSVLSNCSCQVKKNDCSLLVENILQLFNVLRSVL